MTDSILSGIKVLDISQHTAGPYAAKLLADNGAEVIKIEQPGEGDIARKLGPFPGDVPDPEASGLFLALNTSKKGITLDITRERGKEVFLNLIRKADAVIESFHPNFLSSLGLSYDDLAKVNPKLTNWGTTYGELKVFMNNLKKDHNPNGIPIAGIIPTFTKAPLNVHETLEKDNIYIIRFTQRGEISDGVSPGQTQL